MAETNVVEDELFQTFMNRGKSFGLEGEKLIEYVDKNVVQALEREERMKEKERQKEKEESERLEKERDRQEETKRHKLKLDADIEKQRQEEETRRQLAQEETKRLEIQAQIQAQNQNNNAESQSLRSNGSKPPVPKLPPFREKTDDIDSYLFRFENHAISLNWDKNHWVTYLASLLDGTALTLFHSLSEGGSLTYDSLKENLLKKFQCTPDGFRKKFREARPVAGEPFETYAVELRRLFDRWLTLSSVEKDFDSLVDLILAEQLMESVSKDLAIFLCEKDEHKFPDMIKAAESYRRAHPTKTLSRKSDLTLFSAAVGQVTDDYCASGGSSGFGQSSRGGSRFNSRGSRNNNYRGFGGRGSGRGYFQGRGNTPFQNDQDDQRPTVNKSPVVCFLCEKPGHRAQTCSYRSGRNPCSICTLSHPVGECLYRKRHESVASASHTEDCDQVESTATNVVCSVTGEFAGQLQLESGSVNRIACSVLRDTGATVCGVRKRLVREEQLLGTTIRCISFGGRKEEFPLAEVPVQSPYFSGSIVCCVLDAPVADLIIGNVPGVESCVPSPGSTVPFSAAAITRARAKHVIEHKPLAEFSSVLDVTPQKLIQLQQEDASLKQCFDHATSGKIRQVGGTSHSFHVVDGVLFRKFQKGPQSYEQVVVPSSLRPVVLAVSHDLTLAGHCGTRRTLSRLREKFFWPGVSVDVGRYVASCDVCQRSVQKGKVPPVPLASMPLIATPFDRIAVDIVGPLSPVSEQGHRYILSVIDVATRYPEAIPLKDISSVAVAEALFSIFTRLGFPKEILSDRGTQFNSELMKQFHSLCACKGIRTSPYHAQSNGTVERFHGTLKSMLRKVIQAHPKQWHRYLPALLFACRELPSESTGFSPFTLLFGREVRGPIALLQETWTGKDTQDQDAKPLYRYIFELQNVISDSCQVAVENSSVSATKNKWYFDKKAKDRSFRVDDEVLVLLPSSSNKLLSQWIGPFKVKEVLYPNFKVEVRGKDKIFHANMLKEYFHRTPTTVTPSVSVSVSEVSGQCVSWQDITPFVPGVVHSKGDSTVDSVQQVMSSEIVGCSAGVVLDSPDDLPLPTLETPMSSSMTDEDISDITFETKLSESMHSEIKGTFDEFSDRLTTKPGEFTGDLFLEIPLSTDVPVKRKMYNVPFTSKEIIEREVKTMLDLGVIERSSSPYSAPVVLVQKKDGSCRFCIDYRWINKVTLVDAEPIPDVETLFARLGKAEYFTKIDLSKGYWQIKVRPEDRPKTAFATHLGLFQFVRMPFGLVSAPAVFARMMRMLDLDSCSAVNFFDDILVHSISWSQHLIHVRAVLQKLKDFGLTARPSKIEAGFQSLEFLGHVVGGGTLRPAESKMQKILKIPTPTTKKQVRSLLGLLSFYRRYVPNFASLTAPLSDLTKDGPRSTRKISWTPQCAEALQKIQAILSARPVLRIPQLEVPFVLRTDASSVGLGAVLLQDLEGVLHPVVFASRKLLPRECNYSTIERECLAIVWGIQKFVRFLWGVHFVLQTDHRPLTYLRTCSFKNSRVLRWALSLQEFTFEVKPISGTLNILADLMSRASVDQFVP